jgi:streptogramin lyase
VVSKVFRPSSLSKLFVCGLAIVAAVGAGRRGRRPIPRRQGPRPEPEVVQVDVEKVVVPIDFTLTKGKWSLWADPNSVWDCDFDPDGRTLWVCTAGGVVKFDTKTLKATQITALDGLGGTRALATAVDRKGRRWFTTYSGVSCLEDGKWTNYRPEDGPGGQGWWRVIVGNDGTLWFGGHEGSELTRFKDGVWTVWDGKARRTFDGEKWTSEPHPLDNWTTSRYGLGVGPDGKIWTACYKGGLHIVTPDEGKWTFMAPGPKPLASETGRIQDVIPGRDGIMYLPTASGVTVVDTKTDTWTALLDPTAVPPERRVRSVREDTEGRLWCCGNNFVGYYDPKTRKAVDFDLKGVGEFYFNRIKLGPKGKLYFTAMWRYGLFCFDGKKWTQYLFDRADCPRSGRCTDMRADEKGNIWVATMYDGGIARFAGGRWRRMDDVEVYRGRRRGWRQEDGLPGLVNCADFITLDEKGNICAGSATSRRVRRAWTVDGKPTRAEGWTASEMTRPEGLLRARDGSYWRAAVRVPNGQGPNFHRRLRLIRSKDGVTTSYSSVNGLPDDRVLGMAQDPDDSVWVATGRGLARFDGKEWSTVPSPFAPKDEVVRGVAVGPDGKVWIATWQGAAVWDGKDWKTFTTADGLGEDRLNGVAVDGSGAVWFATEGGVSRYVP